MKKLGIGILLLLASNIHGQKVEDYNYYAEKYKGNTVVNSLISTHLKISVDKKKGLDIQLSEEERQVYLKDNAAQFSKGSVTYSEHYKLDDIEVFSLIPKGKKYKKEKVEEFATKTEFSPGIFHNGSESVNFFHPSLTKGAISVVKHTLSLQIPQLLSSFYLEDYYPTELREIIIETDKGVELDFSYVNADDPRFKPQIEETKKGKKYIWRIKDIEAFDFDDRSPDPLFYMPHIIPRIASYQKGDETVNVLRDVKDLYTWYYSLVDQTDNKPSDDLKEIVDSLIKGKEDDLEKVRSIYYWVQDNVRYVAFEEGMEGFIPDGAANVCDKRYGDCKGLTSIMYTMLDYAGVDAYFTWVGTRDRPYRYEEVPTPIVDNHMILCYKYNGEYHLIDGTSNTSPVTEPTSFIQGKEVMIGISKDEYKILEVPVNKSEYTEFNDTIILTIDDNGKILGKGKAKVSGYYASRMKSLLKLSSEDEIEDLMEAYLERGSNKFELDTFYISDISNRESDLVMNYEFNVKDYARLNGDEIYINLALEKIYSGMKFKKDRKIPFEVKFKSSWSMTVMLEVPESYTVSYLPENQEFKKEQFGCGVETQNKEGFVVQRITEYDNFLLLYPESFDDWNTMIKNLKKIYRESVILKKV